MSELRNIFIEDFNETRTSLLSNNNTRVGRKRGRKFKNNLYIILTLSLLCFITWYTTQIFLDGYKGFIKRKYNIIGRKNSGLSSFTHLSINGTKGPITINRDLDDGTKLNLYDRMIETNESFESYFYDTDHFKKLSSKVDKDEEYLCELPLPSERTEGYYLTCPEQYTLAIDNAYYGRYASDLSHCTKTMDGKDINEEQLFLSQDCIRDVVTMVKDLCEGRPQCTLKPNTSFFGEPCSNIHKYLHVKYHCVKNTELKKQKFAIVTFADRIKVNTIYDHAISDLYQYADIHNYSLLYYNQNYDQERSIYYMKLHVVHETLVKGLKTKAFDWILWTDADIIIANPNIKLETFVPTDEKIHFIVAADHHGLNAGVFLIRVHPWSINFMARCLAYQLYYPDKYLEYADQTSINDILVLNKNERSHYVVVPQSWFNTYPDKRHKGDMLLHFAGRKNQTRDAIDTRNELLNDPNYIKGKTNQQMRKEVLDYYGKPRDKQNQIKYVEYPKSRNSLWDKIKNFFSF